MKKLSYLIFTIVISNHCLGVTFLLPPPGTDSRLPALPEPDHRSANASHSPIEGVVIAIDQNLPTRYGSSIYDNPAYQAREEVTRRSEAERKSNAECRFRTKVVALCLLGYVVVGTTIALTLKALHQV